MKRTIALLLCLAFFSVTSASGQAIRVKGYLTNNNLERVANALIALVSSPDSVSIASTVSNTSGEFVISGKAKDPVVLKISHISFETKIISLDPACDTTMIIVLNPSVKNIGNVDIVAKRPAIRYDEFGNVIVAMANLKGHATDNAADALKKMPGVMVTAKGTIMLYGEPVKIQMDGVNVKVDAMTFLRSLPATSLSDAELIATPSGRNGENGAIINLITARRTENGYQANVAASGELYTQTDAGGGGSAFAMFKHDNLYFTNSLSYNTYPWEAKTKGNTINQISGEERLNYANTDQQAHRVTENFNFAWDTPKQGQLMVNALIFYGIEYRKTRNTQDWVGGKTYDYLTDDDPSDLMFSGHVSYQTAKNKPHNLKTSYGIIVGNARAEQDYSGQTDGTPSFQVMNNRKEAGIKHTLKSDYWGKFLNGKLTLYAGLVVDLGFLREDYTQDILFGSYDFQESDFKARELITALYAEANYKISDKFSIRAGAREAYTSYYFNNKTQIMEDTQNFWNNMVWANFNLRVNENYRSILSFNTSIHRPGYFALMPGITYINDYEYERGNSKLLPAKNYNLSLRNVFFDFMSFTIRGSLGRGIITPLIKDMGNNITEYTYSNGIDNRVLNLNLNIPFEFLRKKMSGQLNLNYNTGKYVNPHDGVVIPSDRASFTNSDMSLYLNYEFTERLNLWASCDYMIKSQTLYNTTKGYAYVDAGVSYSFLKNKNLTVAFQATDLFDSRTTRTIRRYDNIERNIRYAGTYQCFTLRASYNFSGGKRFKRQVPQDPNDASRFEK